MDIGATQTCKHVLVGTSFIESCFHLLSMWMWLGGKESIFSQRFQVPSRHSVSFPVGDFIVLYITVNIKRNEILNKCLAPPIGGKVYIDSWWLTFPLKWKKRWFWWFLFQFMCPYAYLMMTVALNIYDDDNHNNGVLLSYGLYDSVSQLP